MELLTEPHLSYFVQLHLWEQVRVRHASLIKSNNSTCPLFDSCIFEHRGRITNNDHIMSVADPGYRRRGTNSRWGTLTYCFAKYFQKYCMKMKEFRPMGKRPWRSLGSAIVHAGV